MYFLIVLQIRPSYEPVATGPTGVTMVPTTNSATNVPVSMVSPTNSAAKVPDDDKIESRSW